MKKICFALCFISMSVCGHAQTTVYLRFLTYNNQLLRLDGTSTIGSLVATTTIDPSQQEFFRVTTFSHSAEQILNIGSQSSGTGAGKVTFKPFTFSRPVDAASPIFFQGMASGTAYKTVEAFFVDINNRITFKILFKLAAVQSVTWAAASCSSDCPGAIENVAIQYGGEIQVVYKSGNTFLATPVIRGWNAVRNISDNDPNTVIN